MGQKTIVSTMLRGMVLVVAVAAVMATMTVALANPAFARSTGSRGDGDFASGCATGAFTGCE